jgi:regulator of sigma E protease
MDIVQYILALLVTLGILVTFHEFGHFVIARWCGVRVLRFSVGFGPPLWMRRDRRGTEYAVAAIPLGGYVKMLDEREGNVPEAELSEAFNHQPPWRRIAIALGGPAANFLLAVVVYWVFFVVGTTEIVPMVDQVEPGTPAYQAGLRGGEEIIAVDGTETASWMQINMALAARLGDTGRLQLASRLPGGERQQVHEIPIQRWHRGVGEPDLLGSLGLRPVLPAVAGDILPDSPAERAGLQQNDRILAVDGESVRDWMEWVSHIRAAPGQDLAMEIERGGVRQTVSVRVGEQADDVGYIGVTPLMRDISYSPLRAVQASLRETWSKTLLTLDLLKKMVQGAVSTKTLGGPILIAQVTGDSAQAGLAQYLAVLALLSISLGVLNLLPIPILDGGHILFYTAEMIIGRPIPERVQVWGVQLGLLLVVGLMIMVFYNDIMRLI